MNKTKPLGLKYVLYLLKKPTAFLLVFSFVVSPLSAFAQFSTTTATSTKSLSDELNGDFSFDSLSSSETGNLDVSRNMFNSKRFSSIDEISGTFNFEVPIAVPPGRNGIEPKLSLRYNSQPQTETSVVGYGWEIPIPFIERVNKRGTDRMFSDTYFYSSLSGELASTSATTYKAKVEDGDFFTYEFSSNSWTMKDRDGTIYKFGHSAATRQDDPNNSSNISKWLLEEIRDRNDNYMTYEYYKNYGQVYPSKITYTHSSTTPSGIFEVEFNRESRGDIATSSAVGFPVNTRQRIYEVVTKVDGVWARKYDLNYSNPEDRTRSLLTSVTEYGRADDGSTTTIPAYEFDYHESDPKGWTTNVPWTIPTFLAKSNGQSLGTLIADPNGDGRPDLLQSFQDATSTLNTVFLHNGSGWATSTWAYPWADYFTVATDTKPFFPGDINADGLDDFIHCSTNPASCNTYLSTGSGWATSTSVWSVPTGFENTAGNTSVRLIDLNGDGLADLLKSDQTGPVSEVYINNGAGWVTGSSQWLSPEYIVNGDQDLGVTFADLNGDGLPDLVRSFKNTVPNPDVVHDEVFLNTGSGWSLSTQWSHPDATSIIEDQVDKGFRFGDINGDGLSDLIQGFGGDHIPETYLNSNPGWASSTYAWNYPSAVISEFGTDIGTRLLDLDSDGLMETLISRMGANPTFDPDTKRVDLNKSGRVDVLSQITYPRGGITEVEYKPAHQYKNGSTLLNTNLPYPILTVSTTTQSDGLGNDSVTSYQYEGGKMYWNSPYDRKFAGFDIVTRTDPDGNVSKTYFHQASTTESSLGEYSDHVSKIGKPYRIEEYDGSNNLYNVTINKWDRTDLGNGRNFVKLAERLSLNYDGDGDHKDALETYSYDDSGNISEKINWGEVSGSGNGTYSDTGTDKFITNLKYATSTTYHIYGLPSQETVFNQSGSKVRESKFYYDTLSSGSVTKGNLTKQEMWESGSDYVDVEKTYNSYGLVATEKDPRDKTTTYTYDSFNLYPATTTNPLSQTIGKQYDYSSGKVKILNDQNNFVFQTTYDGFDRALEEKQPDTTSPNTLVTKNTYTYLDSGFPTGFHRTDYLNSATSTETYTYFDGFGKKSEERIEAEDSNTYAVKQFRYDIRELLKNESLPYFSSGTAFTGTSSPASNALLVRYVYDPLQRVKTIQNNVGTTTNVYDQWKVTTTDPEGNEKDMTKDAYGNILSVVEHNNGSTYTTSYEYNGNQKLTKITDDLGNVRNFTYDGLGKRLTAEDLHDTGDGSYGTWSYSYDDAGNLSSLTDPKSQTIDYSYDDLSRVLTENYTGSGGTEITYDYDDCSGGKGKLCSATSTDAATQLSYNALGFVSSEVKTINSVNYQTSYAYDRLGNKTEITYPDNSKAKYTYNSAGQLETLAQKENGGAYENLVSDFDYAPTGITKHKTFGNCAETDLTYDQTKLYRLTNISTVSEGCEEGFGMGGIGGWDLTNFDFKHLALLDTVEDLLPLSEEDDKSNNSFEILLGNEEATKKSEIENVIGTQVDEQLDTKDISDDDVINAEIEPDVNLDPDTVKPEVEIPILEEVLPIPTTTPLWKVIEEKDAAEKATIKGQEIAKLSFDSVVERESYDIEVTDIKPVEKGVAVFARVWNGESQLGFGRDGSVDIERFIFINPPILVPDPKGDIERTAVNNITGEKLTFRYREDPKEAILQALEHTIDTKQQKFSNEKIVSGKVGNTTTTVYPDSSPESTSVDGYGAFDGSSASWATIRGAATADYAGDTENQSNGVYTGKRTSLGLRWLYRAFFLFDTSSIGNDDIDAATFSQNPYAKVSGSNGNTYISLVSSNPASNTAITTADYDQVGSTKFATDMNTSSVTVDSYNDWTLNGTGLAAINGNGISKFALRHGNDIANTDPSADSDNGINGIRWADTTGTTQDPKLVVEHSSEVPPTPTGGDIQSIGYTYDKVGNITTITDNSTSGAGKIVNFSYDDLNRLTFASTTAASSTPYKQTFAYSSIGNITGMATSSGTGTTTYSYSETNYANPHAATSIGGLGLVYDNNGNVTSYGNKGYTWDYRNRMSAAGSGGATTTFAYDHTVERVKKTTSGVTTYYANDLYNVANATTTKYVYDGAGDLIATIEGNGTATTTQFIHPDHLGDTNVVTDEVGEIAQTLDYYPYGDARIDTGTFDSGRTFIGEEFDEETDLSYLNARYYDGNRGQFNSQDPVFVEVGSMNLANPQEFNSYSYSINNPIVGKDTDGRRVEVFGRDVVGSFVHTGIIVTPDGSDENHFYGAFSDSRLFFTGNLVKRIDDTKDVNAVKNGDTRYQFEVPLSSTDYKNQIDFDNAVINAYSAISSNMGAYSPWGSGFDKNQSNSNNFTLTILRNAGVSQSEIDALFKSHGNSGVTPGKSKTISSKPGTSANDKAIKKLTSIRNKLQKVVNRLKSNR